MKAIGLEVAPAAGLEALARQGMQDARPVEIIGVDMLRRAVLTGLLEAGQLLRQDELATNFGVSRMPVRVALRQLESEGLVRHLPRRGFVVATLTPQEIDEIYEIRALLEGHAMRLAVPQLAEDRLRRLERLLAAGKQQKDPLHLLEAREKFYRELYEAAGRTRLVRLIMQLRAEVAPYLLAQQMPASTESHAELLAICRRRDGHAAEEFMRTHLRRVAAMLRDLVTEDRKPKGGGGRTRPSTK